MLTSGEDFGNAVVRSSLLRDANGVGNSHVRGSVTCTRLSLSMRRKVIAAVWIIGATTPLLLATVFVIGCCALPFHAVMHKLMPLCDMAAAVMRGDHADRDHEHESTPAPSRQKEDSGTRLLTSLPSNLRWANRGLDATALLAARSQTAYRSFISLGAVRCDQDIGLHVLVEIFRI